MIKLAPLDLPARPVARARVAKYLRDIVMVGMEDSQSILKEGIRR